MVYTRYKSNHPLFVHLANWLHIFLIIFLFVAIVCTTNPNNILKMSFVFACKFLIFLWSICLSAIAMDVHYDKELIGKCLQSKKINFLGNSVNRGRSFALRAVLNGHYENREGEKALCGAAVGDESLHNTCIELNGVNEYNTIMVYSYSNTIYSPTVKKLLDLDFDIVVAQGGGSYVHNDGFNMLEERAKTEAKQLADHLGTLAKNISKSIWYVSNTRMCAANNRAWTAARVDNQNKDMIRVNNIMLAEISKYELIHIFDAWGSISKCKYYDDHVHSKNLSMIEISAWLHLECNIADIFA